MPHKRTATLWIEEGWIKVRTKYNADFVFDLKNEIHPSMRSWNPDNKIWMVDPSEAEKLEEIVERYFVANVLEPEPEQLQPGNDPYSTMLRYATDEQLKKVYKLIAVTLHPDQGGSNEDMTIMNTAWQEICEQRGIR